ncbi:hypothetical protein F2P81_005284 [Scophthalmus maximus]|uniref:Uncharacterized protein n=1 Tax=Scophthalmus maximus TaxID=52904 RepID=A0A6A4TI47_SCOMX|nr:hypothetical protein F2P81_005284 [Scophthalmus maximus]
MVYGTRVKNVREWPSFQLERGCVQLRKVSSVPVTNSGSSALLSEIDYDLIELFTNIILSSSTLGYDDSSDTGDDTGVHESEFEDELDSEREPEEPLPKLIFKLTHILVLGRL